MAYKFTGISKRNGTGADNLVCALKVEPGATKPVTLLASTVADANGNFTLHWTGWDGRVAIGHMDSGGVTVECTYVDYQVADVVVGRYSALENLSPAFLYKFNEEEGPYDNAIASVQLEVKPNYTPPSAHRVIGDYLALPAIQANADMSLQEVNSGEGDGYGWLGNCTIAAVVKHTTPSTLQSIAQFRTQGETTSTNVLWFIGVSSSNEPYMHWEYGSAGSNEFATSTQTLTGGESYVIIASRDTTAKEVTFWVNGNKDVVSYAENPTGGTSSKFMIGAQNSTSANDGWRGLMHCVAGWARTITDSEAHKITRFADSPYSNAAYLLDEMIGFWPMDEGAGTTMIDRGPSGYDGVYSSVGFGGIAAPPGLGGNGVALNGVNGQTSAGPIPIDASRDIAMGCWFSVKSSKDFQVFMQIVASGGLNRFYLAEDPENQVLQHILWNGGVYDGQANGEFQLDTWNHLILSYESKSSTTKTWINGNLVATEASTYSLMSDDYTVNFGDSSFPHCDIRGGFIAYGSVTKSEALGMYSAGWDRALDHQVLDNRFIHYTFDNVDTVIDTDYISTVYDEMSNFNAVGPSTTNIRTVASRLGSQCAYSTGSSGAYLDMGDIFSAAVPTSMTITLWFRMDSSTTGALVGKWEELDDHRVFRIFYQTAVPSYIMFEVSSDGLGSVDEQAIIERNYIDQQWHFLAARYVAGSKIEISIDGGDWAQATTPAGMFSDPQPCYLFNGDDSLGHGWRGYIEDFRLHKVALSNEIIDQIQASFEQH